jgi:hypothetical protein
MEIEKSIRWHVMIEENLGDTVSFLERSPRKSLNTIESFIYPTDAQLDLL